MKANKNQVIGLSCIVNNVSYNTLAPKIIANNPSLRIATYL